VHPKHTYSHTSENFIISFYFSGKFDVKESKKSHKHTDDLERKKNQELFFLFFSFFEN